MISRYNFYTYQLLVNSRTRERDIRLMSKLGNGSCILLDYLKDFIRENPNIKFSIDCHSTVNTIKLLRNENIDIGLICNTELPKGIVYSPVKEIHDVFVASPEYLDNFYERANGRDQYSFADELSGNIKGNIIPLLNSGLASATHGDATDQSATIYMAIRLE